MTSTLTHAPKLPPNLQAQLGLNDPRFRPLSDVKTVLRDLGEFEIDAPTVRELVELRVLIGFNIAVDDKGRCELRVLTKSIDFFRATGGKKYHELGKDFPARGAAQEAGDHRAGNPARAALRQDACAAPL
jgi:hypothetical protein